MLLVSLLMTTLSDKERRTNLLFYLKVSRMILLSRLPQLFTLLNSLFHLLKARLPNARELSKPMLNQLFLSVRRFNDLFVSVVSKVKSSWLDSFIVAIYKAWSWSLILASC